LIVDGLIAMAIATISRGLVTATWQLAALRALQGVASGAIAAPTFALAGDISTSGSEARQSGRAGRTMGRNDMNIGGTLTVCLTRPGRGVSVANSREPEALPALEAERKRLAKQGA
jgi:MFS family permease